MPDLPNRPQEPEPGWSDTTDESMGLPEVIEQLRGLTRKLDVIARQVLLMTLLNLVSFAWTLLWANGGVDFGSQLAAVAAPLIFGALALFNVAVFDRARRQGNMLFEAISEELQWRFRRDLARSDAPEARPPLYARIALREFTSSSDLPLVPHPFGVPIFASLNLAIVVSGVAAATLTTS